MLGYRNRSGLALPYMNNSFQTLQPLIKCKLQKFLFNILFEDYTEESEKILCLDLNTF